MTPISDMPCWVIMQCKGTENCPARKYPDIPCWEIAEDLGTNQSALNICMDCIVYVVKQKKSTLSRKELEDIMKNRDISYNVETCPAYKPKKAFKFKPHSTSLS